MSLLSFLGFKDEPEIEQAKKQCDNLMKTANEQVKLRKEKEAAPAVAPAVAPAAPVEQPVQAAGGGRRRKTSRKSPSKKRATKSMFNIKKWNPFK
jgi:hypothetical protein